MRLLIFLSHFNYFFAEYLVSEPKKLINELQQPKQEKKKYTWISVQSNILSKIEWKKQNEHELHLDQLLNLITPPLDCS